MLEGKLMIGFEMAKRLKVFTLSSLLQEQIKLSFQ